jgi:hypothetical protein
MDDSAITLAGGIVNNISDALVTIFPIPFVLSLHLPRRHLIITACLFGLGFVASVASNLRSYYLWAALYRTYDLSWASTPLYTVCAVELNLGLVRLTSPRYNLPY